MKRLDERLASKVSAVLRRDDFDVERPQHGAFFRGKALVQRFIDWCAQLECGIDLITPTFKVPSY